MTHLFGRICAANCLSDIYAMGGDPRTALSILAFPSETLDGEIMFQMLSGAMETLAQAGVALIGGHSIKDDEIKLGFAITGTIDPAVAAALETPQAGDLLVLTKPLGTGVLVFCEQVGRGNAAGMAAAAASMATLNKAAADAMKEASASACTDITGFGLFGHLLRMARQSKLSAEVFADALPAFPGALEAFRDGVIPGAIERNREFLGEDLQVAPGIDEALVHLGCDAQTSGGLLIAVPPGRLEKLQHALADRGVEGRIIGRFVESSPASSCSRTRPRRQGGAKPHRLPLPSLIPADKNARASFTYECIIHPACRTRPQLLRGHLRSKQRRHWLSAEAQKAFGAMMRAAQSPGVLSEKAKELILFSLVLHSRCHPCFDTHYQKARALGITQAELDEAAWCAIAMGGAPVRMFYQDCLRRAQSSAAAKLQIAPPSTQSLRQSRATRRDNRSNRVPPPCTEPNTLSITAKLSPRKPSTHSPAPPQPHPGLHRQKGAKP